MFVSVSCELASDDHRRYVYDLLAQYGYTRVMHHVFESSSVSERGLNRLKRDIDRATDSYDSVRMYQYPIDDTLVITALTNKKWRRIVVRTQ
jgi:CRISPR-associated protein Cas2